MFGASPSCVFAHSHLTISSFEIQSSSHLKRNGALKEDPSTIGITEMGGDSHKRRCSRRLERNKRNCHLQQYCPGSRRTSSRSDRNCLDKGRSSGKCPPYRSRSRGRTEQERSHEHSCKSRWLHLSSHARGEGGHHFSSHQADARRCPVPEQQSENYSPQRRAPSAVSVPSGFEGSSRKTEKQRNRKRGHPHARGSNNKIEGKRRKTEKRDFRSSSCSSLAVSPVRPVGFKELSIVRRLSGDHVGRSIK